MGDNKNDVYIVGGDHHNGLGLGRILGINDVTVHSIVIGNIKESFLRKSKYIFDSKVFSTEKEAFDYLSQLQTSDYKSFVIPYSDTAALELDTRLNEFKEKFFIPSINNTQGKIAELMDKQNQYEFAKSAGIRMAYTLTIDIKEDSNSEIISIPFPCIVKPVISAEGHKRDITVCKDINELSDALIEYKKNGYFRALIQEFLAVDYEIDVFGCVLTQKPFICQIPTRTIRSWLPKGGTNSFSQIIIDEEIVNECEKVIRAIYEYGFYGLYDIELFVVKGEIFLNEINLRNSGDVYMGIAQEYYYPYAWYCDVLGKKVNIQNSMPWLAT